MICPADGHFGPFRWLGGTDDHGSMWLLFTCNGNHGNPRRFPSRRSAIPKVRYCDCDSSCKARLPHVRFYTGLYTVLLTSVRLKRWRQTVFLAFLWLLNSFSDGIFGYFWNWIHVPCISTNTARRQAAAHMTLTARKSVYREVRIRIRTVEISEHFLYASVASYRLEEPIL